MTEKQILKKLKKNEINCEQALEFLSKIGACPNLLNDDGGRWAIDSGIGFQSLPDFDEPCDITTTMIVYKKAWKPTIREALIFWLEDND